MLQELISGVDCSKFDIEDALDKQLGARPLPFPGMDSECVVIFCAGWSAWDVVVRGQTVLDSGLDHGLDCALEYSKPRLGIEVVFGLVLNNRKASWYQCNS